MKSSSRNGGTKTTGYGLQEIDMNEKNILTVIENVLNCNSYIKQIAANNMKVITLKHKDVKGKELNYIKITNTKGKEHLINVGEKTYQEVSKIIEDEEQDNKIPPIVKNK